MRAARLALQHSSNMTRRLLILTWPSDSAQNRHAIMRSGARSGLSVATISGASQISETAIRLNPADPAATFEAWPKALLTAAALQHGERQVRQMLQDRPAMRQYGEEADVLCQWAARNFAGEDLRQKIFWDSSEPFPVFMAENQPPSVEGQGCIRVREKYNDGPDEGKNLCFDELWCRAVFELYNIANADDFGRIVAKVAAGELSRAEFTTSIVECESLRCGKDSLLLHPCGHAVGEGAPRGHPSPILVSCSAIRRQRERLSRVCNGEGAALAAL